MAKILEITPELDPQISDGRTHKSCVATKVVDITEDCPNAKKPQNADDVILIYTASSAGPLVVLCWLHTHPATKRREKVGFIHFRVDKLDADTFVNRSLGPIATNLGLTKEDLIALIRTHAPAIKNQPTEVLL